MFPKISSPEGSLRSFFILWATQALSSLGSAMTGFALVVWLYQETGSALSTSLLTICSYAPYVLCSIFAGPLTDRWDKKITLLVSDSFAALSTLGVLLLLRLGRLEFWHLYLINGLNGLMNTVQQPTADVAVSLLTSKEQCQKVSGLRSFSNSLVTVLTPILATALLSFTNLQTVIWVDLCSFAIAFVALLFFVHIPKPVKTMAQKPFSGELKAGLQYLNRNRGILNLMFFLALINFTASIYNAALPAMVLSKPGGGQLALGTINMVTGLATLAGSLVVTVLPPPKSRVRVIFDCLLFSMSTENFLLAFGRTPFVWCVGAVLGWLFIPFMSANMNVLFRSTIPIEMQGRVYSARNTFQFFTIPLGYLTGGLLVDRVFEPFMAAQQANSMLSTLFGTGKGSGAALLFCVIGLFGMLSCLPFRANKAIWNLDIQEKRNHTDAQD